MFGKKQLTAWETMETADLQQWFEIDKKRLLAKKEELRHTDAYDDPAQLGEFRLYASKLVHIADVLRSRGVPLSPWFDENEDALRDSARQLRRSGPCFVATACCGSPEATPVIALRHFRDYILRGSPVGRSFIAWYYQHGPEMAQFLMLHPTLRLVCRALVVEPAAALAHLTLAIAGRPREGM